VRNSAHGQHRLLLQHLRVYFL